MMMEIERRYGALRVISGLLRVLAWAALILSIIAAVGLFLTGNRASLSPEGLPPALNTAFGAGLISLGVGIVYFILFYAFADSIIVFVDIEENTRTAALLLREHCPLAPSVARPMHEFAPPPAQPPPVQQAVQEPGVASPEDSPAPPPAAPPPMPPGG